MFDCPFVAPKSQTHSCNRSCSIDNTMVQIQYWTGWNAESKYRSRIAATCNVPICSGSPIKDGFILQLTTPVFLSWGSGPTRPIQQVVLLCGGQCGYIDNQGQIQQWLPDSSPTWKLIDTPE